jgi:DNA-binding beta-propeller fold protein YncE
VLAAVEQELADEPFVVVGVHSPKFPAERDESMVRAAVARHGITHPVVVDAGYAVWHDYAVRAWPTLVVVGADGVIVGAARGEPDAAPLLATLRGVLDAQRAQLDPAPLPLAPEPGPPGTLAFPAGIAVGDEHVYVADTNHHQIVVCGRDGSEGARIGSGRPGLVDGAAGEARFTRPHGLAVADGRLLVADTGNHAVRAVDLASGAVTTLAGTGSRGRFPQTAGEARAVDLRSPWDVTADGDRALVAMAGSHQLWVVDGDEAAMWAGSGQEARVDGRLDAAAFAQPSGLAWGADGALYVADSEISAVRRVADGVVDTVAGGDLFAFGDRDGVGDDVRFQHPVGIAAGPNAGLFVADTLNHKIKMLDPATGAVVTVLGDGTAFDAAAAALEHRPAVPRDARGAAFCREPEALAWDGERLLVVDTGNHRVLAVDPTSGACSVWLAGGNVS